MNPGMMLPLPCFLLCIQPVGQKENEANPILQPGQDTSQGRKTSKSTKEGTKELLHVTKPQMQGQSKIYERKGLQLGPHQHKVALHIALHPLGFCDSQTGASAHPPAGWFEPSRSQHFKISLC